MNVSRLAILLCWIIALSSCGSKKESAATEEFVANKATSEPMVAQDQIALGETLVKSNDCSTCHHKTSTLIGPAHTAVANKYEFTLENAKMLAGKIVKGGTGVWGEIPMNAHGDISQSDAEAMARYVLSLDGEKEH